MSESHEKLVKADEGLSMPIVGWRFNNPFPGWRFPSILHIIWLWVKHLFQCRRLIPPREQLNEQLPVQKPIFPETLSDDDIRATWLGHASVLFSTDGVRVLCDPIFSTYCSPVQGFGPKRYRRAPCSVSELPPIDVVVISHTHYDHLDYQSVVDLNRRFPDIEWFVPMNCARWMHDCGCKEVTEMMWWDEAVLKSRSDVKIAFTPTQHWSGRGLFDRNKCLWGSWAVIGPRHRVWFAGDTGYCRAFKEIGRRFGPFDMAAIPIGAYCPRWFMNPQHVDPQDAVRIHFDVGSRMSVGIHWGTFTMLLQEEDMLAPRQELREAMEEAESGDTEFVTVGHGETLVWNPARREHHCE